MRCRQLRALAKIYETIRPCHDLDFDVEKYPSANVPDQSAAALPLIQAPVYDLLSLNALLYLAKILLTKQCTAQS